MTDANTTAKEISDALRVPFPDTAIEKKQGKSYIGHEVIRERVIDATDNRFDWHLASMEYRNDGAIKARGNGEVPLVCVATGTLTIPGLGSRTGIGVQVIEFGGGEDSAYKGAESDAFKRAAMAFGCGLQLYSDNPTPTPQQRSATQHATANTTTPAQTGSRAMSDEQFRNAFAAALVNRNSPELKRLMDVSRDNAARWVEMIKQAQDVKQIAWVDKEMDSRGMGATDAYTAARAARLIELEG